MATIKGTAKHDLLRGTAGRDTILGLAAGDDILGMGGIDKIFGGGGNDTLSGGAGNDVLHGGIGNDVLVGGAGNDALAGDAGDDVLLGGAGNDTFIASTGRDTFSGGVGVDTVTYAASKMWVDVFLADGNGVGDAQYDRFVGIENVTGTAFSDKLYGNGAANVLRGLGEKDYIFGGGGDDRLEGGDGDDLLGGGAGADAFFGDAGKDWVTYFDELSSVTVNLATGQGAGAAAGDTFHSIEVVNGTQFGDTIIGDGADNVLFGNDGSDTLIAGGGNDFIYGGKGFDIISGGDGDDRLIPDDGDPGSLDADDLFGGANDDWVDYNSAPGAVTVNLAANTSGGWAQGDTYHDIENVAGSVYDDTLTPAAGGRAYGDWGDDHLYDAGGTEVLRGNAGDDTLSDRRNGVEDNKTDIFFLELGSGVDTIVGFDHGQNPDRFRLPAEQFYAFGGSVDSNDVVSAGSFTKSFGHAQFFHNTSNHTLWYYDGGLGGEVEIAILNGFTGSLTATDFLIVPGY